MISAILVTLYMQKFVLEVLVNVITLYSKFNFCQASRTKENISRANIHSATNNYRTIIGHYIN